METLEARLKDCLHFIMRVLRFRLVNSFVNRATLRKSQRQDLVICLQLPCYCHETKDSQCKFFKVVHYSYVQIQFN